MLNQPNVTESYEWFCRPFPFAGFGDLARGNTRYGFREVLACCLAQSAERLSLGAEMGFESPASGAR